MSNGVVFYVNLSQHFSVSVMSLLKEEVLIGQRLKNETTDIHNVNRLRSLDND